MDNECFYCLGTENDDEITAMPCCGQSFHRKCHNGWIKDHYYCGYCREEIRALQPLTELTIHRLKTTEYLLDDYGVGFCKVTIDGTGESVDNQDLVSQLRRYIGTSALSIHRRGPNGVGFQPGRLVKVTYVTEFITFPVQVDQNHED